MFALAITTSTQAQAQANASQGPPTAAGAVDEGTPPAPAPPEATAPDPAETPIEVTVEGEKTPPSVSSLTGGEVRRLPGAFGDPFRAIEILPGVTPIVSGLPFFYVRGAPPGNVGYFLDGVRVPYLFHAAAGPSVVHPSLIGKVDLYAGGYPARYGRYAGAIVAAEPAAPRGEWQAEGSVRLVDAGARVEGGFDDGRGELLAAGRYSYTAGLFSLISPDITLDYRDYQARVGYDLSPHDHVSLFAFGAYDFLASTTDDVETVIFGAEFYRVDGRYDVALPKGGRLRAAATWGFDQTRVADGRNTRDLSFGTRVELEQPLGDALRLHAGADVQHDLYSSAPRPYVDPDDPSAQAFDALFPSRTDLAAGLYADVVWDITPRFTLTPGLRVDAFGSNGASALSADPRLAIVARVDERVRVVSTLGVASQPPSFIVPLPGLAVASLRGGLQRSLQAAAGVEVDLPFATTATVTAFDSVFFDMTDALGARTASDDAAIPRSLGGAKGLEVYLRRSLAARIGGFVAYTFSRSTRTTGGVTFPAAFDRTHVLHGALSFDLGAGWSAGSRFSIYSGAPLSGLNLAALIDPSQPERDPPYYRFDFRVEKRWRFGDRGFVSFVVEMLNATLNTETLSGREIGPVTIPSIGVEGGY